MIDLHSHILPGLDDGARDLDEALAIARAAVADGIGSIAATPHVREDYPTSADEMERGVVEFRRALEAAEIELEVFTGAEIALDQLDLLGPDDLRRFGLGGNPSYLLVETPYTQWPPAFVDIVLRLVSAGFTPLIAHPERNPIVQQDPEPRVAALVEGGALVQVTAGSVDGRLGSRSRACADRLIDAGLVHVIASDAHSPGLRDVGLSHACNAVGDDDLARWLTSDVPAAIIGGEPLPPRPPVARTSGARRTLLSRLLGR